jgi:hypothetical protein
MDFAHPEDIEGILTDFNNLLVNYLPIELSTVIKFQGIYIWLETDAKIILIKKFLLKYKLVQEIFPKERS